MTEFRGARGSNTGDDFHELWATRHAIRLLSKTDDLHALAVEGLAARDEGSAAESTWDGVDCTLYFGGSNAEEARQVAIEQLKYSAASPGTPWTISRLSGGLRRDRSVIARLAKAWKGLFDLRTNGPFPNVVLISNQPVDQEVYSAFERAAQAPVAIRNGKPEETSAPEVRLAYAAGLSAVEFQAFAASTRFESGAGSRFALEERVLHEIAAWTDRDIQSVVTGLRQFVRNRMRPEFAGELITRESIMLHLGVSDAGALFPCPSEICLADAPVSRAPVREATHALLSGNQRVCLHGQGGVGKTTALQEIEAALPPGSIMVKYDCYGGGRYLDPSALRHRSSDAFIQLTNELSARLKLPLLLSRHHGSDYPKLFANRLGHAAKAVALSRPEALVVIAVDAADNAVTAAQSRVPAEPCFVHDLVLFAGVPKNVRFLITARSGRLPQLSLPPSYVKIELKPFDLRESAENVTRIWPAPRAWIEDFHHLSGGIPRVQNYAFQVEGAPPSTALDRLRPGGKSLDEVFRQQFEGALSKSGVPSELARLCAALIALPRPVPLLDLAGVLGSTEAQLTDLCADLAPGIRVHVNAVSFADEDFEQFVRGEAIDKLGEVRQRAASWLLARAKSDRYAASNVAAVLVSAQRGQELLELVELEPAPAVITDPVLRREAELQRLRLAIKVCREAHDVPRALRFVLIGAEGIKTETALRSMLVDNPDMAASYAHETAGRLILSDPGLIDKHGPVLFHKLSVDAQRGDAISVREGRRLLNAWMQARTDAQRNGRLRSHRTPWAISIPDIASAIAASLRLEGPVAALDALETWSPRRVVLEIALSLPPSLIAEGDSALLEAMVNENLVGPIGKFFLLVPLALAGRDVNVDALAHGLTALTRRRLRVESFFNGHQERGSLHAFVLDTVLAACEILTSRKAASELVNTVLDSFLTSKIRNIERRHIHEAAKLDLLYRAFALKKARDGLRPAKDGIFTPRPTKASSRNEPEIVNHVTQRDRELLELTGAVFKIYVAIAEALVKPKSNVELNEALDEASKSLAQNSWRNSYREGSDAIRRKAARSLLILLAAGYKSADLKGHAVAVHGGWREGQEVPDDSVIARLSLRQELHPSLLSDLAAAATETQKMRIGAHTKSSRLVRYARAIKPISADDASAIFSSAVQAASELDREVMAQIKFLNRLVRRGGDAFVNARSTARNISDVVADAAIRLEGEDYFPWEDTMQALARLDTSLALANAARWDDELVCTLEKSLPSLLKEALKNDLITPGQASAIALFVDGGEGIPDAILKKAVEARTPSLRDIAEHAAYDVLIRSHTQSGEADVREAMERISAGPWVLALLRNSSFTSALPLESSSNSGEYVPKRVRKLVLDTYIWDRNTLLDPEKLRIAIEALVQQGANSGAYLTVSEILECACHTVLPRDRASYLSSLAMLDDATFTDQIVKSLLQAIEAWLDSPAVQSWCRVGLPEVIVKHLPFLWHSLEYREDDLTPALERTGLSPANRQELLLQGIERHVDSFTSESIFALAGLIGTELPSSEASSLADWYAERLATRIPPAERDQTVAVSYLPADVNESIARFLFSYMGDFDVRKRWRAAHAVRRLARADERKTLIALIAQYSRVEELAFRGRGLDFYWIAARLWFVIAWDRVVTERPEVVAVAGAVLLRICFDETFPHVLIRSFARDAAEKLNARGLLLLTLDERTKLSKVNETEMTRVPALDGPRRHFGSRDEGRRFDFDWMDTLSYWYKPVLNAFAELDANQFLEAAERWIIDAWGYGGDIRKLESDPRGNRLRYNWSLSSNRQGAMPTLERLNNYLEWHAMWCTAGELLKTNALKSSEEDDWDDFAALVIREKLSEPPIWSSDLIVATPLVDRNFVPDKRAVTEWCIGVEEGDHRSELFPEDKSDYIVVDAHCERRMSDRTEAVSVASSLVTPETGGALIRALQLMEDAWDYKLPDEGEDSEFSQAPYCLIGWLICPQQDTYIDEADPLRNYASTISARPGNRVAQACNLIRDGSGLALWRRSSAEPPMFIYEVWGNHERDDERHYDSYAVAGRRLLVHKRQLQEFLCSQNLDLIVEVGVTRRERRDRQYDSEEEAENAEGRFNRLYGLRHDGSLEVAEANIGTWTDDRSAT